MKKVNFITVHASATYPSMDIDVEWIRKIHVEQNGWSDVGYHFFIKRDGTIQKGRPTYRQGAQVLHHNENNLGICMAGGLKEGSKEAEDNFTEGQYRSLIKLITELHMQHPAAEVMGHNGFTGHESRGCPCFDWRSLRDYLNLAWSAQYKPSDWGKHNWKNGFPKTWLESSWYRELVKLEPLGH